MPARKIPKNHLHVTGKFASQKNGQMGGFESLLEKDYMLLLEFDDAVEGFDEQPVTIPVTGVARGYTPDILVRFFPDASTGQPRSPELTEVKSIDDLKRNKEKYAPKFAAAEQYACELGWIFSIKTEKEIRTQRLANIKFLREYRNIDPVEDDCIKLLSLVLSFNGAAALPGLLCSLGRTEDDDLHWLPVIWNMVLNKRLIIDIDVPLSDRVILSLPERE